MHQSGFQRSGDVDVLKRFEAESLVTHVHDMKMGLVHHITMV